LVLAVSLLWCDCVNFFLFIGTKAGRYFNKLNLKKPKAIKREHVQATWTDMDEYNETGCVYWRQVKYSFFRSMMAKKQVPSLSIPKESPLFSVQRSGVIQGLVGAGLSNGQLIVFKPDYVVWPSR
jgi:hypothetical protein